MKRYTCGTFTVVLVAALIASWTLLPAKAQVGEVDDDLQGNPPQGGIGGGLGGGGFGGGFGGGGFFGGFPQGGFIQGQPLQNMGMIQSSSTAVVVSEDRHRIAAYSAQLGQWHVQPLEVDLDVDKENRAPIEPVVGLNMVSVVVGKRVYAYSAKAGKWGELKIPVGDGKNLSHGMEYLTLAHGDFLSMFSAQTGTWATIDQKQAKAVNWTADEPQP